MQTPNLLFTCSSGQPPCPPNKVRPRPRGADLNSQLSRFRVHRLSTETGAPYDGYTRQIAEMAPRIADAPGREQVRTGREYTLLATASVASSAPGGEQGGEEGVASAS